MSPNKIKKPIVLEPKKPIRQPPGETTIRSLQVSAHIGPLPAPEQFAGYEQVLPGAAERILKMAESQVIHRQEQEKIRIQADIKHEKLGIFFGFIITVLVLATIIMCAIFNQPIPASILGAGGITAILTAFLKSVRRMPEEKKEQKKELNK